MNRLQRILASLGIILSCIFLVLVMLVCVARSAEVQTAAMSAFAEQFSRALGTHAEIGRLHYRFPNHFILTDVLVEDQQGETLLGVDTLSADADLWHLITHDTLLIHDITLAGATSHIYHISEESGNWNYQFLVDALSQKEKQKAEPMRLRLRIDCVRLLRLQLHYNELEAQIPAAQLRLNGYSTKHIDAEVEQLAASIHRKGIPTMEIREMEARVLASDSLFSFPKLHIALAHSDLQAKECYIDHGQISVQVEEATFTPSDLSAVLPALRWMNAPWSFSAAVNGTIDSLAAHKLNLNYRKQPILKGDVTLLNLSTLAEALTSLSPVSIDSTSESLPYVRAHCEDLRVSKATLQDILSGIQGKPVRLPDMLGRLGQIHYKGALEGRLNDLSLLGAFTSDLGSVRTDGWASVDNNFSDFHYRGSLSTRRFHLGHLLGVPDLGTIGVSIVTDGHVASDHPFHGTICANLDHLVFRRYTYQDVHLDGQFINRIFNGHCHSNDPNLMFRFDGNVELTNGTPHYAVQFRLNHLRLGALNLSERYADSDLRLRLNIAMQGANLDALTGTVSLNDVCFTRTQMQDSAQMQEMVLSLQTEGNQRSIKLNSDYLTASATGRYTITQLVPSLRKHVLRALPSLFPLAEQKRIAESTPHNELDFYLYARHLEHLSYVFELPLVVPDQPTIKANLSDERAEASLRAVVPELFLNDTHFEKIALNLSSAKTNKIDASVYALMHHKNNPASKHMGDMQFSLSAWAARDSLDFSTAWANKDTLHNAGELHIRSLLSRYADRPFLSADILPTEVLLADSLWKFRPSHITYAAADTALSIDHFHFGSASQSIDVSGVASTHIEDTIRAELKAVDLDYLLGALTDVHKSIYFGGNVTGWATAYGIFHAPMFEASVAMKRASINGSMLGDVYASAGLDSLNHVIIKGDVFDPRLRTADSIRHVCHVDGLVGGPNAYWNLDIYPDSVEVGLINHWTSSFLSNISGRASGYVRVWGMRPPEIGKGQVWVSVQAKAHNIGLTVPFTGGRYYVQDSVLMDSTSIRFPHMTAHDAEGHEVLVDGQVLHDGAWQNITYRIEADARRALVMDLPSNADNLYSGHVYGNGHVVVAGNDKDVRINATAQATGGKFVLSVAGASSARENSFIEFVDHTPQDLYAATSEDIIRKYTIPGTFDLSLQVEVTPLVECEVLIDRRTGDCLRGRGEGNVRLHYSTSDLSMLGSIALQQGTFGFTFQNVIRREFQLAEGSSVVWTGNPENPELNAKAIYKVTASLRDLLGTEASSLTTRSSVPVNCVLNLNEHLNNPVVRFGIELPSSDESIVSEVRSVINTEDMLTRQVLYLLVFSRFYTPEYIQQTANVGVNETYSLISSTITGQINSWLSRLTDMVQVGFNFRTDGEGADASQEYEAQFEIRPVRGLMINGNFGYRYNDIANQPVFGNLDVEYMLTPNGKLRVKGYSHTVDKYSLRQANTVQGVGFVFKHDFNWPERKKKK